MNCPKTPDTLSREAQQRRIEAIERDPYMVLAGAKSHLADHQPMTRDDEEAWSLLDYLQGVTRGW